MSNETRFFPVTVPYQGPGRNQSFGVRTSGRNHKGVDFTPPVGIQSGATEFPILAYRGGKVEVAQNQTRWGMILIRHDDGSESRYLHNHSVNVAVGATVVAGQQIANMGGRGPDSATAYTPHLHFELRTKDGTPEDPAPHLLDANKNPLSSLTVVSHPTHGPPASEGGGI